MKLLVTGDWHLNDKHRDRYRHGFQQRLQEIAQQSHVDRIIILGDLTEEKDHHSAWLVNRIVDHMKCLTKIAPVTILRGNHDYLEMSNPFFEFLGKIDGITWIGDPNANHLPGTLFLPHTRNYLTDWQHLEFKKFDWVYTHNTFDGALSESGKAMRGIPLSIFDGGPMVISGDVHVPQTIDPVTYVGAPYHVDFGDKFKARTLLIDDKYIESVYYHGPQKRLVEISWPSAGADVRVLEEAIGKEVKKGDLVKVRVHLEPDQYDQWDNIYGVLRKWGESRLVSLTAVSEELPPDPVEKPAKRLVRNDDDLMKEYAKKHGANDKAGRTLRTGMLLKNAGG